MDVYIQFIQNCKWMGERPSSLRRVTREWQLAFEKGGLWRDVRTSGEKDILEQNTLILGGNKNESNIKRWISKRI
jgi:hypothetical protein